MIAPLKPGKVQTVGREVIQCMVPNCVRPADTRGVCKSCYTVARNMVRQGSATWEEIEDLGLIQKPHIVPRAPMLVALLAAREQQSEHQAGQQTSERKAAGTAGRKAVK